MKVNIGDYPTDGSDRIVDIEISSSDTYSLDSTLALIIHASLLDFKKRNIGYWNIDKEDLPDHINDFEEYGHSEEGTNWIIDELIWTFWAVNNFEEDHLDIAWMKKDHPAKIRFNNGLRLFAKYYQKLWW